MAMHCVNIADWSPTFLVLELKVQVFKSKLQNPSYFLLKKKKKKISLKVKEMKLFSDATVLIICTQLSLKLV